MNIVDESPLSINTFNNRNKNRNSIISTNLLTRTNGFRTPSIIGNEQRIHGPGNPVHRLSTGSLTSISETPNGFRTPLLPMTTPICPSAPSKQAEAIHLEGKIQRRQVLSINQKAYKDRRQGGNITFICNDGEVKAHRDFMKYESEMIKMCFSHDWKENTDGTFDFSNLCDVYHCEAVVEYVYFGKMKLYNKTKPEIMLEISAYLNINELIIQSVEKLIKLVQNNPSEFHTYIQIFNRYENNLPML
eukprot:UN02038